MCTELFLYQSIIVIKSIMRWLMKMSTKLLKLLYNYCLSKKLWFFTILLFIWNWNRECVHVSKKTADNPVILWWTSNFPGTMTTRFCSRFVKCEVFSNKNASQEYNVGAYLFYGSSIEITNLPNKKPTDIWGLYHEESPRNLEVLMHEPMLNLFNFSSTFSRHSNVPFPLQYLESIDDITSTKYFVSTSEKNKLLNDIAPILYLQSDCETSTERDDYVKELMKLITIDSYGACLNNKELPKMYTGDYLNNLNEHKFLNFVARYKFVIAIENGVCEDYVTEKFWRAIKVGSVPIYFGSPSVRDWFPNNRSAILLDDFPTPEVMSKRIRKLLEIDNLYEEYLEHKIKGLVRNERLLNEVNVRPYQNDGVITVEKFECFICEKLHKMSDIGVNIVNKLHYNCPKPVSALSLGVNPSNHWVQSWNYAKRRASELNEMLRSG